MNIKKQAFTLVELIVVITILAILGTIAFLSFTGYSRDSRNSVRYNDLRLIEAALEQYHIKVGKYPEPTLPVEVTFANTEIWLQGTFGDSTFGSVGKLDHKPVDPLTGSEYTYSLLNTKGQYEVAAALEGTSISEVNIGNTTYAGDVAGTSLVLGTYNGKMLKVNTGGLDYVLAVPTIISGDITLLSIDEITFYKKLAYNGSNVIAGNYKGTDFDMNKTFDYDLTALEMIVFTGSIEDLKTDESKRVALLENLQIAYNGTEVERNTDYEVVKDETIDIGTPSDTSKQLAKNVIYNAFKFEFRNTYNVKNKLDCNYAGEVIYGTLDGADVGLTCNDDIIVCGGTGTGITISACNLGAIEVGTGTLSYGGLYQWGNNYDFRDNQYINNNIYTGTIGTITIDTTGYGPGNYYNSPIYTTGSIASRYDWSSNHTVNLWGGNGINTSTPSLIQKLDMRGPCPINYHIPTQLELENLVNIKWDLGDINLGTLMINELKMPMAGSRGWSNSFLLEQGSVGTYWSSVSYTNVAQKRGYYLSFLENSIVSNGIGARSGGGTIRCFKN